MPIPVAGLAGDDLELGAGDLRAVEQLHRRQVSEEQLRKACRQQHGRCDIDLGKQPDFLLSRARALTTPNPSLTP